VEQRSLTAVGRRVSLSLVPFAGDEETGLVQLHGISIDRPTGLRPAALDAAALAELRRTFRGELVVPGSPSYDDARRVWNGSIDRRPALIARCTSIADVSAALQLARRTGLAVAVRGGGHSFPGLSVCDGGVVIDLRSMNTVRVDPATGRVRAGAGTLLGELDAATQAEGLAVPVGAVSHTGVAGLTLGGGIGWLMRKHGLTIDALRSVDMVTTSGARVRASETDDADLFWALRGGGGNFGIVTGFEFEAVPVGPEVLGGLLVWPLEDAEAVVRSYRDWAADAPEESMSALVLRKAPAIDAVPSDLHGRDVAAIICCWCGDVERGLTVLRPLREFGQPAFDGIDRIPFLRLQSLLDASYPHGTWAYVKACDIAALSDDVIDIGLTNARRASSPRSGVIFWQGGGAVARVAPSATSFGSRGAGAIVNITGATGSVEGFAQERDWARAFWSDLIPHQRGVYVNFLMDEGEERVREAYGDERMERLRAVKRAWDPDNVLRLNQNIEPA
jgi:FAD/FMN-containing dehydrogenase